MKICFATPISSFYLQEFLDAPSAKIASKLSNHDAPAVTNLVKTILNQGHDIYVFTKDPETIKPYCLKGNRLTINVIPSNHKKWRILLGKFCITDLRLIWTMWRSNEIFDIVSVQWTRDYAIGSRKFFGKCPVTCTVRDVIPLISKIQPIRKVIWLQNEITLRCNNYHFIANSEYTRTMIHKYWSKKSIVIPNGISEEFLEYETCRKNETFTFVSISTAIDGRKNIELLVRSYYSFHKKHPNSQLFLIGPVFTHSNSSVLQWERQGLMDGIELMGTKTRKEIKTILSRCHCLVHTSLEETFGNILIEAMACKCLVIGGHESGAVPYVLHHGEIGLLCNVKDELSIESVMEKAFNDNHEQMIEKAFSVVHNEFSPNKVAQKYLDYFEFLINEIK